MGAQERMVIPVDGVHHVHQSSPGKGISVIGSGCILCHQIVFIRERWESGEKVQKSAT